MIAKTDMVKKYFERFLVMEVSFDKFQGADHQWGVQQPVIPSYVSTKVHCIIMRHADAIIILAGATLVQ